MEPGERRRSRPVRALGWLVRPFSGALVTGTADPPGPRPAWRRPDAVQHMVRYLPTSSVDIVVVIEILTALAIFVGTYTALVNANYRNGIPVTDKNLLLLASIAVAAPLLLRDRWPLAAWRVAFPSMIFAVSLASTGYAPEVGSDAAPYPLGAIVTYLLVLYSVGLRAPRHISVGVWILSCYAMVVLHPTPSVYLGAIMTGAALVYGYTVRGRRSAQLRAAEQEQLTEDERAARAVLEERSRIARELHDVVAHHMSVIAIQAEAAPLKAPADPEALKSELAAIRATALQALTELRRVLGVLREGGPQHGPQTTPQPDLSQVGGLFETSRAAGQAITVTTTGKMPAVPAGVSLAAYRVLQESLSNALRHAPGAPVRVYLDYRDQDITLRVENDPPTGGRSPAGRGGQGLAGMRERVSALGGTLTTGPTLGGGFSVAATLPLDHSPATEPVAPAPAERP